jgi:hypothetical protein
MDADLLFSFGCVVGFFAGYGVREVISQLRRRKERSLREERERAKDTRELREAEGRAREHQETLNRSGARHEFD